VRPGPNRVGGKWLDEITRVSVFQRMLVYIVVQPFVHVQTAKFSTLQYKILGFSKNSFLNIGCVYNQDLEKHIVLTKRMVPNHAFCMHGFAFCTHGFLCAWFFVRIVSFFVRIVFVFARIMSCFVRMVSNHSTDTTRYTNKYPCYLATNKWEGYRFLEYSQWEACV
jgi:hypothetical protein